MHVWNNNRNDWVDASDEIEILEEGAVARKTQHQVAFAGNLNDPNGTINLLTPDGNRLRSRVLGLAFTESDTGKSTFIAEAKDSQGFVLGRNRVIYVDAFDSVKADVRYSMSRASFEADVILREKLPDPTEFGLRRETVKLEVWTEFLEAPEPEIQQVMRTRQDGQDEPDAVLAFGPMRIGPGKAFSLAADQPAEPAGPEREAIPVSKSWEIIEGRKFLIENVSYLEAKPQVDRLPDAQARARVGEFTYARRAERIIAAISSLIEE
jgi:hypothetical protein